MFPAIRTAFAVSIIGFGLIALALPAHAQSDSSRDETAGQDFRTIEVIERVEPAEPKVADADARAEDVAKAEDAPDDAVKANQDFDAKADPKVIQADRTDDGYGYYDDYGYYTDAGYSDHGYEYNSCQ